jgi:hypothetical protein
VRGSSDPARAKRRATGPGLGGGSAGGTLAVSAAVASVAFGSQSAWHPNLRGNPAPRGTASIALAWARIHKITQKENAAAPNADGVKAHHFRTGACLASLGESVEDFPVAGPQSSGHGDAKSPASAR